jgi:hypothetical protein
MAEVIGTRGTGITQTTILKLDVATEVKQIIAALPHTMAAESYTATKQLAKKIARDVLEKNNLPTDPRGQYAIKDGIWSSLQELSRPEGDFQSYLRVFTTLGIPHDSPGGYAAQVLVLIEQIDERYNRPDEALALAITLGELLKEASMKAAWEEDALRGEKILRAAHLGNEMAYGSQDQRKLQKRLLKEEFQKLLRNGMKPMAAYRALGVKTGLNPKTIQRKICKK